MGNATEAEKVAAISTLLSPHWPITANEFTPGSYYDWVGSTDPTQHPHLLTGDGYEQDPQHYFTPLHSGSGCTGRHYPPGSPATEACLASVPLNRMSIVGVSQFTTLRMRWTGIDIHAQYTLKIALPGRLTHNAYGSATDHGHDNAIHLWAGATLLYGPRVPLNISVLSLRVPKNETAGQSCLFH